MFFVFALQVMRQDSVQEIFSYKCSKISFLHCKISVCNQSPVITLCSENPSEKEQLLRTTLM